MVKFLKVRAVSVEALSSIPAPRYDARGGGGVQGVVSVEAGHPFVKTFHDGMASLARIVFGF
jgi:hypothetical protein